MKKHWGRLAALCLCALGLALLAFETHQVGRTLQYITAPPAPLTDEKADPGQPIRQAWEQLQSMEGDWEGILSAYTLTGIQEGAAFTHGENSTSGRLECLGPGDQQVYTRPLLYGRTFYEEELKEGRRAILIDEQLALKLFRVADAVDKTLTLQGQEYTVIGVLRHQKKVGDLEEYGACIPLMNLVTEPLPLTALMVSAQPIPGTGASTAFEQSMAQWLGGGTLWDLGKEAMGARIWLRVLLFALGLVVLLRAIRQMNRWVLAFIADHRRRLQSQYAVRMLPRLMGFIGLFLLGYAACALTGALLVDFIVKPVYTFPEWVPQVLVEWEEIAKAFWNVWQLPARTLEYRSPQVLRLRFLAFGIQWLSALSAVLLARTFRKGVQKP